VKSRELRMLNPIYLSIFTLRRLRRIEPQRRPALIITLTITVLISGSISYTQDEGPTRHLWDTAYLKKATGPVTARKSARRVYKIATPNVPVEGVSPDTVVGVTIWRLRPARSAESGERIIVHEQAGATELVPERVSADSKLNEGDRVRISIEAARTGYLYVIDRERYANGTVGEPVLIFPTTRTRGGDNRVKAGRVIEIPSQDDSPPFFTMRKSRADNTGENLIVLVTLTALSGLEIGERAQKLDDEKVAMWEKSWGNSVGRLDMENSEGLSWTKSEREAGADATRSLTEEEPAPQTLYYRPGATAADPVLVKVQLQYVKSRPRGVRR
jgi:hypothetical protein